MLKDELQEINVSLNELARALRVPRSRISAIVNGKGAITVDTAMRLARYFGTGPITGLIAKTLTARKSPGREIASRIEKEVLPRNAA